MGINSKELDRVSCSPVNWSNISTPAGRIDQNFVETTLDISDRRIPPRDLQIVYAVSTDQGTTWPKPAPVHSDKTPNIVRGFFDATVLANGEIGVAYLNDIEGKAHQRDLRFVSSTGNRFGTEKILDPFVCDCCNISLLVD